MSVRVAVLADTSLQRHLLQHALSVQGYSVALNTDPHRMQVEDAAACQADVWLVNLARADDAHGKILDYLYETETPVLFGEGEAPQRHSEDYQRWERSLLDKLAQLVKKPRLVKAEPTLAQPESGPLQLPKLLARQARQHQQQPAREVWLLAASLGGPEAVKEFLDVLPGGLPVGFIYAQHIGEGFEEQLPQVVGRHSQWPVRLAEQGDPVRCGEVVVVPVRNELRFTDTGVMQILDRPWTGLYSPSIEQTMLNLTQRYAERSGVIVFSGMGEDGVEACAYAKKQGALIWAQSTESCACPSMPDSIRNTGYSTLSSSPRGLAMALLNHLIKRYTGSSVRIS